MSNAYDLDIFLYLLVTCFQRFIRSLFVTVAEGKVKERQDRKTLRSFDELNAKSSSIRDTLLMSVLISCSKGTRGQICKAFS